ncbi:MAG: YebC/PmpR family DNA-binding transcriptional regulator [Candidatus Moranbacteria bacterium]|nr:YebC/PmpR family DNA-binding transcriptional regulator [Candidatus Moranbacteria bacterium]
MSGHSHWAGIKHRKGINDAKRANIFTKFGRLITIAARGGGNPDMNFKLKLAIDQARSVNMPKENIERAIKRGTGELKDAAEIQEIIYEAYGPGQVAMLVKAATDNKNRTQGEIKNIIAKAGGKMVSAGSVSFLFKQVGNINVTVENKDPYETEMKAIDAGAEDTVYSENILTIYTRSENLQKVKDNLEKAGLKIEDAALAYAPLQKISLSENDKLDYEKLLENLDEQQDVQIVYDNL